MKLFISWSGERSRAVGRALRDWIPLALHFAQPWLSERDIDAGERWAAEIGKELESSHFGIICLTQENLNSLSHVGQISLSRGAHPAKLLSASSIGFSLWRTAPAKLSSAFST